MRIQLADGRKLKYASERLTRRKMMTMAEVIRRYLDGHGVNYKLHVVNGPTMTAQDAANQLHVPLDTVIKSILFTDEKQTPILAILTGDKRADRKKLASVVGASKVRIGTPEATRELAGFEVGVMPPVAHKNKIVTVIDQKVMSFNKVYGGSGTAEALMEIDPHDIARLTDAKVADISE
jgi:Cys-tRNA(Pro) deacylase